jgi:hypothetical protein
MLLFVQLERFDSKVFPVRGSNSNEKERQSGQFQSRHTAGVILRGGGIVVAKIDVSKPNSGEIMHRNPENDCLVLIYPTKGISHGSG